MASTVRVDNMRRQQRDRSSRVELLPLCFCLDFLTFDSIITNICNFLSVISSVELVRRMQISIASSGLFHLPASSEANATFD